MADIMCKIEDREKSEEEKERRRRRESKCELPG